jgi:hypothetical protein
MAIHGYPGGFVTTATPTVSTSSAKGIWTKAKQLVYQAAGSWPLPPTPNVEYLVVAGGGAGSAGLAGGGGAGGFRTASGFAVASGTPLTVTVGAGGSGAVTDPQYLGTSGLNSVFSTITATGGGYGGSRYQGEPASVGNGGSGGSGGGGGDNANSGTNGGAGNAGSYSPVEGYAGGNAVAFAAGGGGGASQVGYAGVGYVSGAGGNGTASSISGSSVTYAGGGGGGARSDIGQTAGAGGTGGGGAGGQDVPGANGTTNLGGGGGGGAYGADDGGNGGSGIVIIRYVDTYPAATSTTGSPTITVAGGYRVYKWTGSGSITI